MTNLRTQMLLAMCWSAAGGPCGNSSCDGQCGDLSFAETEMGPPLDAALAAIEAAGFTAVPREATEEMVEAGMAARKMAGWASGVFGQTIENSWRHEFRHELRTWAAMLDAAPKP